MGHGSSTPTMYFPVQGTNKYGTTDFMICKSFRIDAGAQTDTTKTTETIPDGAVIFGWRAIVTETFASSDATSVALGFTGTESLLSVTKGTLVDGYVAGPELGNAASAGPLVLNADDTFDVTISATATLTAGKLDVDIYYAPPRNQDFDTSYKEYVST